MPKKTQKTSENKKRSASRSAVSGRVAVARRLLPAILTADIANAMMLPFKRSIANLLEIAAGTLGSDEASVLVRNGNRGGLKFLVAIGEVADKLLKVRIPPGRGIAGFVFSSGQPMAVADVSRDESFYSEVDRATGYSTHTILATPLRAGDEIVGVLEFVNRLGDPPYTPFTPDEMDKAAIFADAIATLVDASESASLIASLFRRSAGDGASSRDSNGAETRRWIKSLRASPEHRDMLQLADLLREIASRGDAEREMCRDVLTALSRGTEKRSGSRRKSAKY